jgi:molecular chaperone IbpA
MTTFDFHKLYPFSVGFERIQEQIESSILKGVPGYPPYNIKKVDDNKYAVELAVAGFAKTDIDIELADGVLKISGATKSDDSQFLHKGIADRSFTRSFQLADSIQVKNADLVNGMLKIWLENVIPESKKPKKVPINDEPSSEQTPKETLME